MKILERLQELEHDVFSFSLAKSMLILWSAGNVSE